jgi:hypothetical protein
LLVAAHDPTSRHLSASIAANERWALVADPSAATAPARAAFNEQFDRAVDPDGALAPDERARRADRLRKAHFARMALKSAGARRAPKAASTAPDAA